MAKFVDASGREWVFSFTVGAIKRVREACGVDLARLAENEFRHYLEVAGDPVKLADVLFTLAAEQHPAVTLEQFYEGVSGDFLHDAADAFQDAFLSFCPRRQREALTLLAAKQVETEKKVLAAMTESLSTQTEPSSTTATSLPA